MVTVYRIEDEEGHGPYGNPNKRGANRSLWQHEWAFNKGGPLECDTETRPGPGRDFPKEIRRQLGFIILTKGDIAFGFADYDQLARWFDPLAMNCLATYGEGFGVATYEVEPNDLLVGQNQVAFLKSNARRVGWRPIEAEGIGDPNGQEI